MQQTKTNLSNLNEKQREAVVSESKRLLVLAGAGSGKTKTLLQKIIYLVEEKNVPPSNILAVTFTKNAANEMLDRLIISADKSGRYETILQNKLLSLKQKNSERYSFSRNYKWISNLTLKTFHSLCYGILRDFGVNEYDNLFKIITDSKSKDTEFNKYSAPETSFEVLHKILIKNCENKNYLLDFKRYILDYTIDKIHFDKYTTPYNRYAKNYTTLNGTKVRSKSEQYIADWLFRHNIDFKYEPYVNFRDFGFKPDFFIPEANLYIEHVSDKSYPITNKKKQFEVAGKTLLTTYESQTKDTALFNLVLERIIKGRLPENYIFNKQINFEEEFRFYHKEVKDFLRQVMQVIDMLKVENFSPTKILNKALKDQHERIRSFYKLAIPLYKQYKKYCINKSYLDFNDMVSRTISLFDNYTEIEEKFQNKFQYILVDEFQDVNSLQVELIKRLLTKDTHLFCVGDDWQSIYGFRGSNVNYIINFKEHFKTSRIIKLRLNYRSTQNIVGASNEVIKHNKLKINKKLEAFKKVDSKIFIFSGSDSTENTDFAVKQIKKLQQEKKYKKEDILFLYRRSKMYVPYFERFRKENVLVSAKTIHASKGLEAKIVFIIGLTEGRGGFPDIWLEDRIYQIIKPAKHDLLLEEERRLFYVAITRAKEQLYLITEKGNESSFLREIPQKFSIKTSLPLKPVVEGLMFCPNCNAQLNDNFAFCPFCGEKTKLP